LVAGATSVVGAVSASGARVVSGARDGAGGAVGIVDAGADKFVLTIASFTHRRERVLSIHRVYHEVGHIAHRRDDRTGHGEVAIDRQGRFPSKSSGAIQYYEIVVSYVTDSVY